MATYTNQFPANPNKGDVIVINKSGNYVFARGEYQVEAASAAGGSGQSLGAYTSKSGGFRSYLGGLGGAGIIGKFPIKLEDMQNAIAVVAGAKGYSHPNSGLNATDTSQQGGDGGAGAGARLTVNGTIVAEMSGGGAGKGSQIGVGAWQSNNTRNVTGGNGAYGANGTIVTAPTGYTTAANTGDGYIKFTILSLNNPPSVPDPISYGQPMSGRELLLKCALSTDPDPGDYVEWYHWEGKTDIGGWLPMATTSTNQATITVPTSGNNITFRVKAEDSRGAQSGYATGSPKVIIYNFPPTISGVDEDGGEIHDPFAYNYSVDDQDAADILTVTVYLDTPARRLDKIENAVRNQQYSIDLTSLWEYVSMGNHTLVIHAKDDKGGEAYRRIAFARYSNKLEVELEQPIKTADLWKTLIPMINFAAGNDYTLTVKVKNDPLAAWEDVTPFNHAGKIYEFLNNQKTTAGDCEFYCYVSIEKGPSKSPIEFRGGTFICNANGIEVSYATGVKVNTSLYPSQGTLGPEHDTVQQALNALSIAAYQAGLKILDAYGSEGDLRTAHPTGTASDMYAVWDSTGGLWNCYVWSASANDWKNIGPISGIQGQGGTDGKSAYQIWLDQGNTGTEQDFLNDQKGKDARFGGYFDTLAELQSAYPGGNEDLYLVGEDLTVHYWNGTDWTPAASIRGEQGNPGQRGSVWHRVAGAPANVPESLVGDWAIDVSSYDLYEKTGVDTWNLRGNIRGETGPGFSIKGTYPSMAALQSGIPSPEQGDVYNVGTVAPYTAYMWDNGSWLDQGTLQGPKGDPGASNADDVSVDISQYPVGGLLTNEADVMAALATLAAGGGGGVEVVAGGANGNYAKFDSGMLLCWLTDWYLPNTSNNYTWVFPHEFVYSAAVRNPLVFAAAGNGTPATVVASSVNSVTVKPNYSATSWAFALGFWK